MSDPLVELPLIVGQSGERVAVSLSSATGVRGLSEGVLKSIGRPDAVELTFGDRSYIVSGEFGEWLRRINEARGGAE